MEGDDQGRITNWVKSGCYISNYILKERLCICTIQPRITKGTKVYFLSVRFYLKKDLTVSTCYILLN